MLSIEFNREVDFDEHAMNVLTNVTWAQPLLACLNARGGVKPENIGLLFELRFALELYRAGITAEYEYATGVGDSSIDFRFKHGQEWLIEVVSVFESEAVKRATRQEDQCYETLLMTNDADPTQSPEGEMIRVGEKIGDKVFDKRKGKPTKFPIPNGAIHLIVVDMRGYLGRGLNSSRGNYRPDYLQIAYGTNGNSLESSWMPRTWPDASGNRMPIKGLFEKTNPLKSAALIQQRIHFLGFVHERQYSEGEIADVGFYIPNISIFNGKQEARNTY